MTKLVVVLAVVVVVILVIVIIAARTMRSEDPEEFAGRPGGQDGRDARYGRGGSGRGGRPSPRPGGTGRLAGASAGRGFGERRYQQRSRGYDRRTQDGRGHEPGGGFDPGTGRGYIESRGAQRPDADERRRGDGRTQRRPEESQAPARPRQARGRRSGDSSEWDSSEWEKLSDVDYWAELAAYKPLTTTAQPASEARSGPDRDTEALARRTPPPGASSRQDPAAGFPVRGRLQPAADDLTAAAAGRTDFITAPVPASRAGDTSRPIAAAPSEAPLSWSGDPASLPGPGQARPQGRPRVDPDDDPLTSPSFPRIPASDSRSYRNGRADTPTPPRGSSAPPPYQAPTRQFASYGSPGPLPSRDAYPAPAGPPPARPAAPAPPTAGNPYGSYVTPDSQASVPGHGDYSGVHPGAHSSAPGNDHRPYLPPAHPGQAGQPAGNAYWHHQPSVPGGIPDPGTPSYLDGPGPLADPLGAGSQRADYSTGDRNGYGAHDPAGYPPGSYPAGPQDSSRYAPPEPYGRDGYGGYPEYGATGR
jgi:hypothetical protein